MNCLVYFGKRLRGSAGSVSFWRRAAITPDALYDSLVFRHLDLTDRRHRTLLYIEASSILIGPIRSPSISRTETMLALRHRSLGRALVSSRLESRRVGAPLGGALGAARTAISARQPSQSSLATHAYSSYAGHGLARQYSELPVAPNLARRTLASLPQSADDATTTTAASASSISESAAAKSPSKRKSRTKSKATTSDGAAASSEANASREEATSASSSSGSVESDAIGSEDGDDTIVQSTPIPFVAVTSPAADAPPGTGTESTSSDACDTFDFRFNDHA
jgi:hypothetical protein